VDTFRTFWRATLARHARSSGWEGAPTLRGGGSLTIQPPGRGLTSSCGLKGLADGLPKLRPAAFLLGPRSEKTPVLLEQRSP